MYVQTFVAKISIEIKVRGKGNVDDTTLKFPLFRAEEKYRQVHLFPASSDRTKIATNPRIVMKQIEDRHD